MVQACFIWGYELRKVFKLFIVWLLQYVVPWIILVWFSHRFVDPIFVANQHDSRIRFAAMLGLWVLCTYAWYRAYWHTSELVRALVRRIKRR